MGSTTPPTEPYVCCELHTEVVVKTRQIKARLAAGDKASQAQAAADALGMAIGDLVDGLLLQLFMDLAKQHPEEALYNDAVRITTDIKDKVSHHLLWLTRFLSNERMAHVVDQYLALIQTIDPNEPDRFFLVVQLDPALGQRARQTIDDLRSGTSKDVSAGIEVLLEVVDALLVDFVYEPKRQMQFNFVVNKTLDGIIYVIKGLAYQHIRNLGKRLPADHVPIFLNHLEMVFRG